MKHIKEFNEYLNEAEQTQKSAALDFVEKKGKASWKEIHSFLMRNKRLDPDDPANRGNMASYFSGTSSALQWKSTGAKHNRKASTSGVLMIPTMKDPRYLEKDSDGKYFVKVWDKKSKLDY